MSTATPTLTDFLLARIAEDETGAAACRHPHWRSWAEGRDGFAGDNALLLNEQPTSRVANTDTYGLPLAEQDHAARFDPSRVLAECEAKRRIVELAYAAHPGSTDRFDMGVMAGVETVREDVLQYLALPYADHPDYRDEWRP